MKPRPLWIEKVRMLWKQRSIVWLSGVRRIGKTFICKQIPNARYLNCDLPSIQRQLADPEFFLEQQDPADPIILDEIHRSTDPSLILKIAADEYPDIRILATGSSTLQATKKFRDSLAGRKHSIHLVPVLWRECDSSFGIKKLDLRLLNGGFPEMLLSRSPEPAFFEEWIDSFYARDIQELFGVRNRTGFLTLLKLLCMRSGGQIDISDLAKESGMSRPTVLSHMDAMEIAHAIVRIPPFHGGGHREIIKRPRVYAFDTGIIAHVRGWEKIRDTDRGHLWEHVVLDELRTNHPSHTIHYWRDKSNREIDFIIDKGGNAVDAVEAKINPDAFSVGSLRVFREIYPEGANYVVCPFVEKAYTISKGGLRICICGTRNLGKIE
jgi:predicted AAA+ superfamily ATPase